MMSTVKLLGGKFYSERVLGKINSWGGISKVPENVTFIADVTGLLHA